MASAGFGPGSCGLGFGLGAGLGGACLFEDSEDILMALRRVGWVDR